MIYNSVQISCEPVNRKWCEGAFEVHEFEYSAKHGKWEVNFLRVFSEVLCDFTRCTFKSLSPWRRKSHQHQIVRTVFIKKWIVSCFSFFSLFIPFIYFVIALYLALEVAIKWGDIWSTCRENAIPQRLAAAAAAATNIMNVRTEGE